MIIDAIINLFVALPTFLLSLLPDAFIELPPDVFKIVSEVFYGIGYVLPMKGLFPIIVASFAIISFEVTWSIVLRIKSFIPTMGS